MLNHNLLLLGGGGAHWEHQGYIPPPRDSRTILINTCVLSHLDFVLEIEYILLVLQFTNKILAMLIVDPRKCSRMCDLMGMDQCLVPPSPPPPTLSILLHVIACNVKLLQFIAVHHTLC